VSALKCGKLKGYGALKLGESCLWAENGHTDGYRQKQESRPRGRLSVL